VNGDDIVVLDGCTFVCSLANGDIDRGNSQGLFYRDVRHLSRWRVELDGRELEALSGRRVDYYSARVVGTPRRGDDERPTISVRRDRFLSEGVHEDVVLQNNSDSEQEVRLELRYGADFADIMEAQEKGIGEGRNWADLGGRSVTLWHERDGYRRGTRLTFNRKGRILKEHAAFGVKLRPRGTWRLCVDITPIVDDERKPPLLRCDSFHDHAPKMPKSLDEWLEDAPEISSDDPSLDRTYRQSLLDLAALRVRPDNVTIKTALPGGGIPWFMTVFGRDSLITAYEAVHIQADLAQAALEALAQMQATEWDSWRDAEPGKILHELRRGTLAALNKIPHNPYYGSHDSTLLWLILLDEYERWTADTAFVRTLENHARAALGWLEGPADLDGDGYIEYRKRSESDKALDNHGWKDSRNAILCADGRQAKPPIALCEHQGYAYDARLRMARLLREVWADEDEAQRLEADAADLKRRFNKDFWSSSRRHFVLALDGDKQQVDALTSNVGHLLWSGIATKDRAAATVRRLMRDDMFTGWGIRTMSSESTGYNPLEYHNGTVWPHDTALIAHGMRRYGFHDEAATLCEALLDAAKAFSNQLPEVFAGFRRDVTDMPVEYPEALKPQSWAAAAPLLALRTLLGLGIVDGRLRSRSVRVDKYGKLSLRGISVRGSRADAA
jgi:glycogen debranching enzyme